MVSQLRAQNQIRGLLRPPVGGIAMTVHMLNFVKYTVLHTINIKIIARSNAKA